jgi:hypothetical protein
MNPITSVSLLSCICVACGSIPAGAARGEPMAPVAAPVAAASAAGKHRFEVGTHTVRSLVDTAALRTGRIWIVHPQEMEGAPAIDMQNAVDVADADIESFVSELLWSRGYVVVVRKAAADAREVVSLNGPRGRDILAEAPMRSVDEVMAQPASRTPVRVTMQLQHVNATIVMNAMRPFFAQSARSASLTFGTAGNNSMFVISGIQCEVAQAVALLRAVDKPDAGVEKQVTDLQAENTVLRAKVRELEKQQGQKED